jgi:hypothetical protein
METIGRKSFMPSVKYKCHWPNFHEIQTCSTTRKVLLNEFHENPVNSLVIDARSQMDRQDVVST